MPGFETVVQSIPSPASRGRATNGRGERTRLRILDCAETLFAQQGFRATTLREIAALAKVEVGLTTYHFGSKRGLIYEVLYRRTSVGENALATALDKVEQAVRSPRVPAILGAFADTILVPLEKEHPSGINYLRLVVQRHAEIRDVLGENDPIVTLHRPVRERYIAALERALPTVAPLDVRFAFDLFEGAFSTLLFAGSVDVHDPVNRRKTIARMRRILLPFGIGGFATLCAAQSNDF